ncbi:MAG: DUF535 family protein [Gallionella sp.]
MFFLNLQHVYRETKFLYPETRYLNIAKRLAVVCWCLPFLHRARLWLDATENPLLIREFALTPEIREFLYRPYINKFWNSTKRLKVIEEHYRLVHSNVPLLNLAPDTYIDLAICELVPGKLRVVLDRPRWMRREGEIGISLFLGIDRIFTVMFILSGTPADMVLIIGCVQGADGLGKNIYKELTSALYGMRPRDFILHIIKIISEELHCKAIYGIADAAHRSAYWYSKSFKYSCYDDMWLEHGGKKTSDGQFFKLAPLIVKRADENITAKKRGLYRRRYQFLDDLRVRLQGVIAFPPPKNNASEATLQKPR